MSSQLHVSLSFYYCHIRVEIQVMSVYICWFMIDSSPGTCRGVPFCTHTWDAIILEIGSRIDWLIHVSIAFIETTAYWVLFSDNNAIVYQILSLPDTWDKSNKRGRSFQSLFIIRTFRYMLQNRFNGSPSKHNTMLLIITGPLCIHSKFTSTVMRSWEPPLKTGACPRFR